MKNDHLKYFSHFFIAMFFIVVLVGCKEASNEVTPEETVDLSHFTAENFPRVDGSTSNRPMMVVLACEIFKLQFQWFDAGDATMQPFPVTDSAKLKETDFARNITFYKTIRAYDRLIYDSTDVILVANAPSQDHLQLAASLGVSFSIAPIALDGIVFLLNSANPVNNLTTEQIIGIYTGQIKNWKEVGGNDVLIGAYIRNRNSGSQELMEQLVMQGRTMIDAPDMILFDMMGLINKIITDQNGIGYTVYYYNATMVPRNEVKRISINGIKPDAATINSGAYRYVAPVYAIIRTTLDKNSNAYLFWKWMQTNAGQLAVAKSGYVAYSGKK
ncbi:MAG: substrate-binding domain-containing protein [Ignavibacteriales bacterium]|nr:substrate-binding domain-containing protein [Ignavibacteriales bacterium]